MSISGEAAGTGTTYPCPACLARTTLDADCPGCGRAPDPAAAEVARIDARLAVVVARIDAAQREMGAMSAEFQVLDGRRRRLVQQINATLVPTPAARRPAVPAAASTDAPAGPVPPPDVASRPGGSPDVSPGTLQNLLFVVGGLLLGVGAVIFTAVAWQVYGVTGRATVLGGATVVAFALPPVALRRRLAATAETFAVIALLLLGLDGVALWSFDLLGVHAMHAARYAAVVCVTVAAAAAGYAVPTRLAGPRFVALLLAQPVLPLAVLTPASTPAATAGVLSAVALLDLLAVATARRRGDPGRRPGSGLAFEVAASVLAGGSLAIGTALALAALLRPDGGGLAGGVAAVAGTAATLAVAGRVTTRAGLRTAALAGATLQIALVGTRVIAAAWPGQGVVAGAVVVLAAAAATAALPARVWCAPGLRLGAWVAFGVLAGRVGVTLLAGAADRLVRATPFWHADLVRLAGRPVLAEPWAPLAVAVAGVSVVLLRRGRDAARVAVVTVALLPLAVPVSVGVAWWAGPLLDAAAVVPLVAVAAVALRRDGRRAPAGLAALVALVLGGYAAGTALARPVTTAAAFGGLMLLATALVVLVRPAPDRPVHTAVAGTSLCAAMLALPVAAAALAASGPHPGAAPFRAAMAAVVASVALLPLVRRARPTLRGYAVVTLWTVATLSALAPFVARTSERPALYALTALVLTFAAPQAAGVPGRADAGAAAPASTRTAVWVPAAVLAVAAVPVAVRVAGSLLVAPYGELSRAWSGAPAGTGVPVPLDLLDVVAVLLAAVACVLGGLLAGGRVAAVHAATAPVAVAVLAAVAAAGAPWPAVPAVSALLGATMTGWWALALDGAAGRATGVAGGVVLAAGAAGLAPTRVGSVCGLGALLVTAVACAVAGRASARRVGGWLGAVGAAGALAVVAPRAAGAAPGIAAVALLAVAAVAVLASGALRPKRDPATPPPSASGEAVDPGVREPVVPVAAVPAGRRGGAEALALEGAGHAAAVVALALSAGLVEAAVLSSAWGVVTGARALWPGTGAAARRAHVAAAAALQVLAWWLLAADLGVHAVDAYTVPLAVVALCAGWYAARADPTLHSWTAYGPGLLAGFVPALVPLLSDVAVTRRVVLGVVALLVLLAGVAGRLRAPAVVGGVALSLVALHELVLIWQSLPTWAPLSAGGVLLLVVAVTYERRHRDWVRLRGAISRMT